MTNLQKANVWKYYYKAYYPFITNNEGHQVSVQNMTYDELHRILQDFQEKINNASNCVKNYKDNVVKIHQVKYLFN